MLKKDLIPDSPIENYYETFQKNGRAVIEEVITEAFQKTKVGLENLFQKIEQNKELKRQINSKKGKANDIQHLDSQNHLIKVLCIFLVGLPFLGKYFQNKKRIEYLKKSAKEDKRQISESENDIFASKIAILSEVKTGDLVNQIFTRFGFEKLENFDYDKVIKLTRSILQFDDRVYNDNQEYEPKILGFERVDAVRFENRPFYDVTANVLVYTPTFVSDNNGTKLVRVPEVKTLNWIFGLTNFLSPLAVSFDQERCLIFYNENDKIIRRSLEQTRKAIGHSFADDYTKVDWQFLAGKGELSLPALSGLYDREREYAKILTMKADFHPRVEMADNPEFTDIFPYFWRGSENDITKFFSQDAQENIMSWFNVDKFSWNGLAWAFMGGEAFFFNKKEENPNIYPNVNDFLLIKNNDLKDMKIEAIREKLIDKLFAYFSEWFNRTQWLFLIPGISHEWYNNNLYYTTDREDEELDRVQRWPNNLTMVEEATRFLSLKSKIHMDPWIDLDQIRCFQFNDQIVRNDVLLCSFTKQNTPVDPACDEPCYYKVVSEPKVVYTAISIIENTHVSFLFDADHPHGVVYGSVTDVNELPEVANKLFNEVSHFCKQHPELLSFTTMEWKDNYGIIAINNVESFVSSGLEDELEDWLNEVVNLHLVDGDDEEIAAEEWEDFLDATDPNEQE